MRILSFGHIPSSVGGRQSSGLANVIYQLAVNCAKQDGIKMFLAATDVFVPEQNRENLTILGWTKGLLLKSAILHLGKSIRVACNAFVSKSRYRALVSIPGLFLKSIFLDYAIRKVRPDIIHLHGANSILYFPVIPNNIKLVVTLHGDVGNDKNLPYSELLSKIERDVCSSVRIDKLCMVSSTIPDVFNKVYGDIIPKYQVILNAYDSEKFKYIEPKRHDKLTLCTIASFSDRKGQERVVEALIKSNSNYKYICIGYISDIDMIQLEEKAKNIDFKWLGVKKPSEIRDVLAECDYMILPSSSEGFGLVYLEAIACGVPVIIPKDLPLALEGEILNEKNAIRIKGCSVEAIADILPSLLNKAWNRQEVSQSIISYTWENIAKEYREVYSSLTR